VPRVSIAEVLAHPLVDAAAHLDPHRVERYGDAAGAPVVVFETPEGLLLADGHHRVAAARVRGETEVEADVRPGSRADALRYAAVTGAAQRGISVEEALGRIAGRSGGRWGGDG
jgi:ParB-like nuclease domain